MKIARHDDPFVGQIEVPNVLRFSRIFVTFPRNIIVRSRARLAAEPLHECAAAALLAQRKSRIAKLTVVGVLTHREGHRVETGRPWDAQ